MFPSLAEMFPSLAESHQWCKLVNMLVLSAIDSGFKLPSGPS